MRGFFRTAGDSSGMALLVTLFVMVILAVLVHQFTFSTRVHLIAAANVRDQFRAECLAFSGVEAALAIMEQEEEGQPEEEPEAEVEEGEEEEEVAPEEAPVGGLEALLALSQRIQEFGETTLAEEEGSFRVELLDESAKIDINSLVKDDNTIDGFIENQLRRLLRLFGHTDDELDELLDPLLDWQDKDDDRRPEGAEAVDYESSDEPYACRNGRLRTLGELTLVKGWKGLWDMRMEDGPALVDFLTVGPTGGKININTAAPLVLQSLNEKIDEAIADEIMARREELPFDNTADFFVLLDFLTQPERNVMSAHIQTEPSLLSISSEGTYRRAIARVQVRVKKEQGVLKIISRRVE